MGKQYFQGDLMFDEIEGEARIAVKREIKNGKYILARGEKTGHTHTIDATDDVSVGNFYGDLVVIVGKTTEVKHESDKPEPSSELHQTLILPEGAYIVTQQRRYEHKETPRAVID